MAIIDINKLKDKWHYSQGKTKYTETSTSFDLLINDNDIFDDSSVVEIKYENTIYILPAGYSKTADGTWGSRQYGYKNLYINNKFRDSPIKYYLCREPHNLYDNKAVSILCKIEPDIQTLHLGYIPKPINILIDELLNGHPVQCLEFQTLREDIHDKYIAPIFKWKVPDYIYPGNNTQPEIMDRFLALMDELNE